MQKLLDLFKAYPNLANRVLLEKHIRKHPMAVCLLSVEDSLLLKEEGLI